jgi:hypothetical protein
LSINPVYVERRPRVTPREYRASTSFGFFFRRGKRERALHQLLNPGLGLGVDGKLLAGDESILRVQLGIEGANAVQLAEHNAGKQVVYGKRILGMRFDGDFKFANGLLIFEVVEVFETAPGVRVVGMKGKPRNSRRFGGARRSNRYLQDNKRRQ